MAKRFTDTSKWAKESFASLSLKMKLVWIYLCDNCDHAGVWDINIGLMSYQMGQKITLPEICNGLGDKVHVSGKKLFIPSFFNFQYENSKEGFRAKQSAIEILKRLGFADENGQILVKKGHSTDSPGESMDTPSIGIGIGIGINKDLREKIEKIYSELYPLKKGKQKGVEKLLKELKPDEVDLFEKAVLIYAEDCQRARRDPKYIKHFSTFAGEWRDCLEPGFGQSSVSKNERADLSEIFGEPA